MIELIKYKAWKKITNVAYDKLLEDNGLSNSDADMVDKILKHYNPEYFASFHYTLMVSLMVLKLSVVASLVSYILLFYFETILFS